MFKNYIIIAVFSCLALSCSNVGGEELQPEEPLDNGLYIAGPATGYANPVSACAMSKGVNAVSEGSPSRLRLAPLLLSYIQKSPCFTNLYC